MSTTTEVTIDRALQKRLIFAWLDALRSGEWTQTKGCLENAEGNCCLGVVCRIYQRTVGDLALGEGSVEGEISFDNMAGHPPPKVRVAIGLATDSGVYTRAGGMLTNDNDGYGEARRQMTFPEIADIIEKNAATLFVNGQEVAGWLAARTTR